MILRWAAICLICAAALGASRAYPQEPQLSTEHQGERHDRKPERAATVVSLRATGINSAYTDDTGTTLKPTCNVAAKTVVPAYRVVTLHLTSDQLGHFVDGQACTGGQCLTQTFATKIDIGGGACVASSKQCLDSDAGGTPSTFPPTTKKDSRSNYNTRFDINLINAWKDDTGTARPILIQISLDDPQLEFYGNDTSDASEAVQMSLDDAAMFDCLQKIKTSGDGVVRSVAFRAIPITPIPGQLIQGALNINLRVREETNSGLKMPLIIDPKVPNSG